MLLLEDRGTLDSQPVPVGGHQQPDDPNPIIRNGLVGGDLYVFRAVNPEIGGEGQFGIDDGTLAGEWVKDSPAMIVLAATRATSSGTSRSSVRSTSSVEDAAPAEPTRGPVLHHHR